MTKFLRVVNHDPIDNPLAIFNEKYQNTSPFQILHTLEITIQNDEQILFDIRTYSAKQSELIKNLLEKYNLVSFCPLNHSIKLNIKKSLASEILKLLSEYEGFDDFLLCEIQEQLKILFEWDDSVFICNLTKFGFDETTEITELRYPEYLFRLGKVMEQRIQDLCDCNIESILSTINCYSRVSEASEHFIEANQRICTLIQLTLAKDKSNDFIKPLLSELVEALYKLKQHEKAAPYLVQLHESVTNTFKL